MYIFYFYREMPSCFPNIHLLGLRKSATTDFSKFFRNNIQVIFQGEVRLFE